MMQNIKDTFLKALARIKENQLVTFFSGDKGKDLMKRSAGFVFGPGINNYIIAHELCFVVIYKLILTITYVLLQSSLFEYAGFLCEFHMIRFIAGWVLYLVTFRFIRSSSDDVGSLFLYTIFLLSIAPFIVFFEYSAQCKLWMVLLQLCSLLLIRFLLNIKIVSFFKLPRISYTHKNLRLGVSAFLVLFLVYTVIRFGFPDFSLLSFENIYLIRKEVEISTLESILQNVVCKILCPIYLIVALREKKWLGTGLAVLVQLYV